jgi:hypothetical protein
MEINDLNLDSKPKRESPRKKQKVENNSDKTHLSLPTPKNKKDECKKESLKTEVLKPV